MRKRRKGWHRKQRGRATLRRIRKAMKHHFAQSFERMFEPNRDLWARLEEDLPPGPPAS